MATLSPGSDIIKRGRVDDIYMDKYCALVSLYSYRRCVPCFWGSDSLNQIGGAKQVSPPAVGTEVGVILSADLKYGYIIGMYPSSSSKSPSVSAFNTPVNRSSDSEAHQSAEFKASTTMMDGGAGIPVDAFPGDVMTINGSGAMLAVLEFFTAVSGGPACGIEAFVLDQLLRVTGWNMQVRNSLLESSTLEDHGMITEEESGSHIMAESLGNDPEGKVGDLQIVPARRFQNFRGFLGGLIQKWILRPSSEPADMSKAEDFPDVGLFHQYRSLAGLFIDRSVVGGGMMKVPAIPVPKKKSHADSPTGDTGSISSEPMPEFKFDDKPGTPAGRPAQMRDFIAWLMNLHASFPVTKREKDWHMPDEASCAAVAEVFKAPGDGGFFREYPEEVDAMSASSAQNVTKDGSSVMKTRPGIAWVLVTPEGGIHGRDIWGTEIYTSGGHCDMTASKDIRISAGRNLILMGGSDVIIKGHDSVDITSTTNQVRIKSELEMFIHAEKGGMLVSLGASGRPFQSGSGEELQVPGICFKVPGQGGILLDAYQLTTNLSGNFFINQGANGEFPHFVAKVHSARWEYVDGGGSYFKSGDKYVAITDGNIFTSGNVQGEGNAVFKGGGAFGSEPTYPTDFNGPSLADAVGPFFQNIDALQGQIAIENLNDLKFTFRTDEQYSADGGVWFEHAWQREMVETKDWRENPASDGSYPYPGRKNYIRDGSYWKYDEQNVEAIGRSKSRDSLSSEPKGFTPGNWHKFQIHT